MMQVHEEDDHSTYVLRSYELGDFIQVNNQQYHQSLILSANQLIADWRPQSPDDLRADDWSPILTIKPEILIIGTGEQPVRLNHNLMTNLVDNKIGIETMDTGAACRTYAALVAEDRAVVAALFIHSHHRHVS